MRITALAVTAALSAGGAQAATLTPIMSWNGSTGYVVGRPLVVGSTVYGVLGYPSSATGSVYALTPPTTGTTWTKATIASFSGGTAGGYPVGGLVADSSGNLYGAAFGAPAATTKSFAAAAASGRPNTGAAT